MTDPRLERLRNADSNGNAYLVPEMRDAWPAVVALVEGLLAEHRRTMKRDPGYCVHCAVPFPCPDAKAALAVLDRIGAGDG
jgi:hypothetical protein